MYPGPPGLGCPGLSLAGNDVKPPSGSLAAPFAFPIPWFSSISLINTFPLQVLSAGVVARLPQPRSVSMFGCSSRVA